MSVTAGSTAAAAADPAAALAATAAATAGQNRELNNNRTSSGGGKIQLSSNVNDFLTIKSTAQQLSEGVERPVDSAYIDGGEGQLMLKAVFDVQHFQSNEIDIKVEGRRLHLHCQAMDDQEEALYRKTMIRTVDLPDNVDPREMKCEISPQKILTISMPFHLVQTPPPIGPTTVPILTENGRRVIRLQLTIGHEFAMDEVKVTTEGQSLFVAAFYEAEVGAKGIQVTKHEIKREFRLPEHIEIDDVSYSLSNEGILTVVIRLRDSPQTYRCNISTEEIHRNSTVLS